MMQTLLPICWFAILLALTLPSRTACFVLAPRVSIPSTTTSTTELSAIYTPGRSSSRNRKGGRDERSKRQFRVGEFVRTELAQILHTGNIKGDYSYLEQELRQRISIVGVDVSPDLRQARVSVSIRGALPKRPSSSEEQQTYYEDDPVVDKRRAFSWLVDNTHSLKHTLAQKMSHMKTSPNLTFNQVDVAAATDVMYLIDKVSKGYEREAIGEYEFLGEFDDEDDIDFDDDEDWDEMDEDFFETEE